MAAARSCAWRPETDRFGSGACKHRSEALRPVRWYILWRRLQTSPHLRHVAEVQFMYLRKCRFSFSFVSLCWSCFLLILPTCLAQSASKNPAPVLDVTSMDRTVDPCVDFFQYACGGWVKSNPIPPEKSSWAVYFKVADENLAQLRTILDAAAQPSSTRNAYSQKIGDYYASCMDEHAID